MVNPTPVIALDGEFVRCDTETRNGATVFSSTRPTLVGELKYVWGRSDVWTQPEPTVLTFTMFDPTGAWLARVRDRQAIGRGVLVWVDRTGRRPGVRYLFQGFTTDVDVSRWRHNTTDGPVNGYRVQVQAVDRSGWLGNISFDAGDAPEETMQLRAVRIRNQATAGGAGIREFYFEDRFKDGQTRPVTVTDKTVLEMTNEMYQSFADQWTYNPHRNVITRIVSGSLFGAYSLTLGVPFDDPRKKIGIYPPTWTDPTGQQSPIDQEGYPGAYIGGCDVLAEVALSASTLTDITHIVCQWKDKPNGYRDWVTTVTARDATPRRLLKFDSWYNNGTFVDPVIEDVRRLVTGEATKPAHPRITWDTRRTNEIAGWDTFESLTLPAGTIRQVVVAASPFTVDMQLAPVWHPAGGEVIYENGYWRIGIDLAPSSYVFPSGFTPVTFGEFADKGWRYADYTKAETYSLDNSVTYYDLSYVDNANASFVD
ncbi:hypothetical protein ACVMLG_22105, partial [Escherichia coli]